MKVPVYGGVQLSQEETDCLSLPIKHCLYPEVKVEDMKLQSSVCNTKVRWDRKGRDFNAQGEEVTEQEQQRSMEEAILENEHREVYNPDTHSLDFRKLMATRVKSCPRVEIPPPRTTREEALLANREAMVTSETKEYISECQGQRPSSLTRSELKGLKSLQRRKKAGDIIVYPTDKSGKTAVTTPEY